MHQPAISHLTAAEAMPRAEIGAVLAAGHRDLTAHFRALAQAIPDQPAVSYLERGEAAGAPLSFAALDRHARSLAAYLQQRQAEGARALMLFDAGVELVYAFLGCVYGRAIAVPLPAPVAGKVDRYLLRVKNVVADGAVRFALTTAAIKQRLQDQIATMSGFENVEWIAVDELPDLSAQWRPESVAPGELAYLQYTSGSTSVPKGVMVTHHNLLTLIRYNGQIAGCAEYGTRAVCWMPYFHDFGMIDGLLTPLAHGMAVYLMSPFDFVQQPMRWLRAIDRHRATHSSGPNFSFDLVVRKSTPEERTALDLGCWRRAHNASEPIRAASIGRFLDAFTPHGFAAAAMAPTYGLAEATLLVTLAGDGGARYFSADTEELSQNRFSPAEPGSAARTMVGSGQIWPGPWQLDLRIVDADSGCELAPGAVGEVWVSGDIVAAGYWNRPQATAERFHCEIAGRPGRRYLRTGDLGFMAGAELVITGRCKDVIIVEGRNHYPQDIEGTVEKSHGALRPGCTIAFAVETEEQTRVVVVCEIRQGYQLSEEAADGPMVAVRKDIERAVRKAVAEEHQLRAHDILILHPGLLPKTTSGKVERSDCKSRYLEGVLLQGVPRL
ncbi:fatty acyl-AMP ligase [Massilia sp. MB5]|uniref:fatty acyl-AMP ligase n=1 Tax=Massilia sp. MB5 TaxID=2919578 RepID=UPI001F0DB705|nr:fatty acyl-AMP ligase [Massilia sp. MB5]UMR29540.1 fatty acyl-AMP ligase [Massilia sp. MB5]